MDRPPMPPPPALTAARFVTPIRVAICVLFAADVAFVALFLLMQSTGRELDVLSVAAERSLPTWYASVQLLLLGQVLAATALLLPRSARAAFWALLGLAAFFVLFSADEVASFHERFGWRLNAWLAGDEGSQADFLFARTGYWMVVLLPLALGVLVGLGRLYARFGGPSRSVAGKALLGIGLLLGGAAGIEALQNFVPDGPGLAAAIAAEEGCELLGVTLLLWCALNELISRAEPAAEARWAA